MATPWPFRRTDFNRLWEAFQSQSPHWDKASTKAAPSPTCGTFHSPTPVGVYRHVLLLPINNSWWLCKPRGKVLVRIDMQFDLLLSGGKTTKEWHPLEVGRRGFNSCGQLRLGGCGCPDCLTVPLHCHIFCPQK